MAFSPSFKRVGKAVLLGAVIIAAINVWWSYFSPEGKRRARVEGARIHARDVVMPLLAKEQRFAEVRATEWWKGDGYLWLKGGVETERTRPSGFETIGGRDASACAHRVGRGSV